MGILLKAVPRMASVPSPTLEEPPFELGTIVLTEEIVLPAPAGCRMVNASRLTVALADAESVRVTIPSARSSEWLHRHISPTDAEPHNLAFPTVTVAGTVFLAGRPVPVETPHGQKNLFDDGEPRQRLRQDPSVDSDVEEFLWETIRNILEPPLPRNLPGFVDLPHELYPYQRDGIRFLAELDPGGVLGDDMGLGKTAQAIVALRMLVQSGRARRAIVLCPKCVLRNWERELQAWAPLLRVVTAYGEAERRIACWSRPAHVYLTTYATAREDVEAIISRTQLQFGGVFDVMIIDEAHNLKNSRTKQHVAIKRLKADRKWGLSGTPMENRLDDLVSIYGLVRPGLFAYMPSYTAQAVRDRMAPYFLRRRKEEVLTELPPKINAEIWLDLLPVQQHAYDRAEQEGVVELGETGEAVTVQHVLALIQKLKMLCNFHQDGGQTAKGEWLLENIDGMLADNGAVLVFSHFVEDCGVNDICAHLADYSPERYTGAMTLSQRDVAIQRFKTDPDVQMMVLGTRAGGVGINLQEANYVVHFDHWWNPQVARQAEDRAHRLGQERTVFVYHLWTRGTIEERIYNLLREKQRLYDFVVEGLAVGPEESMGLSEDELFGLFGLSSKRAPSRSRLVTADALRQMDPRRFEQLIADLWEKQGYKTQLTPASHDGGIDVLAIKEDRLNPEYYAIQCKRYSGAVGREDAQKLLGAISSDPRYREGLLVSTGGFTTHCKEFCRHNGRIRLMDVEAIVALCQQHTLDIGSYQ